MIILLVILGLIIAIIVLAIQYFRIASQTLNKGNFKQAVEKTAKKAQNADPRITCDFCGAVIDTSVHRTCPNCGASYDTDKEWVEKKQLDRRAIHEGADAYVADQKDLVRKNTAGVRKKLKAAIIALSVITAVVIALGLIAAVSLKKDRYEDDRVLNEFSWEHYVPVDYAIKGDGILLDDEGVTITLKALYKNEERENDYKVEFEVDNRTKDDIHVGTSCICVNGYYTNESYLFLYNWCEKNQTTLYKELYLYPDKVTTEQEEIISMTFEDIHAYDKEYDEIASVDGPIAIETTSALEAELSLPDGDVLYDENDVAVVYTGCDRTYDDEPLTYHLAIVNRSAHDYRVNGEASLNGKALSSLGIRDEYLGAGGIMCVNVVSYDDAYMDAGAGDLLTPVFHFTCEDAPEANFSTPFMEIVME